MKFSNEQIDQIVTQILYPKLDKYTIFTFNGPLGVGKTTLIRHLLRHCGIQDVITSPTFTYVNTYKTKDGRIFNHFDLYRLPDLQSFLSQGFEEFFYKDPREHKSWNFIEWPEVAQPLLLQAEFKSTTLNIFLRYVLNDFNCRIIELA